jgi:hypothetical protein
MKRLVMTALALVGACALTSFSSAAGGQPVHYTLSGTAEWSAEPLVETFSIHGTLSGPAAHGGTYSGTLHAGVYSGPTPTCGPVCAPVTGTIDFVTPGGSFSTTVETGEVSVESTASHTSYGFRLTLGIVGGTRSYARASGELALEYLSFRFEGVSNGCQPLCPITDSGTLTGTVVRAPSG